VADEKREQEQVHEDQYDEKVEGADPEQKDGQTRVSSTLKEWPPQPTQGGE
jgi:hypothetical protein